MDRLKFFMAVALVGAIGYFFYFRKPQTPLPSGEPASARKGPDSRFAPHLVTLEGDFGVRGGFIGVYRERPVLFTSSLVGGRERKGASRGNVKARLSEGTPVGLGDSLIAADRPLLMLAQNARKQGIPVAHDLEAEAAVGDAVALLGARSGGIITEENSGTLTAIGPQTIGISAAITPGDDGSPVVHLKSGKVIGVVSSRLTHTLEVTGGAGRFSAEEKQVVSRLDNAVPWTGLPWARLNQECARLSGMDTRTEDLWHLAMDISQNGSVTRWADHTRSGNAIASLVTEWKRENERNRRPSKAQSVNDRRRFVSSAVMSTRSDLPSYPSQEFTGYHQTLIGEITKERRQLIAYFHSVEDKIAKGATLLDPRAAAAAAPQ